MSKRRTGKVRTKILAFAILSVLFLSIAIVWAADYPHALYEFLGIEAVTEDDGEMTRIDEFGKLDSFQEDDSEIPRINGFEKLDSLQEIAPPQKYQLAGITSENSGDNVTGYPTSITYGNGAVNNGYAVDCYSYWFTKDAPTELDGFYFSNNATGSYTNSSFTTFGVTNATWANSTVILDNTLGDIVGYQWFANTSASKWNSTALQYFTVSATITFAKTAGVTVYRNGTNVGNGTVTTYTEPTVLNMTAVASQGYEFDYWSWYAGASTNESLSFWFTVDASTTLNCYALPLVPSEPDEPIIPPIGEEYVTLFFYYHPYTFTINNQTGFATLTSPPNSPNEWTVSSAGSSAVSWGARVWLDYSTTSTELSAGSPILIGTLTGENATLMTAPIAFAERGLTFGYGNLRIILYSRFGAGDWVPSVICVTDYLYYTRLMASNSTLYLYATRTESGGSTYSTAYWGTSQYLSGIADVTFKNARGYDWQQYYLGKGNLLGFLSSPYTTYLGNGIYAIVLFGVGAALYIRYRTFAVIALLIVLLGGVGGVINLVVGEVFMGVLWIVAAFGVALVYWRVFR